MQTFPKVVSTKTKIRFQDCDPFNHLNNGKYTNYFINHREDALAENYDIDIYKMAQTLGKSWVSSSNQIVYLKEAILMETVLIESQLIHYTESELLAEMRMYDENKTQLKAVIWSGFVHFDIVAKKRSQHSEELMDFFKRIHNPINSRFFEERIIDIRKNKTAVLEKV